MLQTIIHKNLPRKPESRVSHPLKLDRRSFIGLLAAGIGSQAMARSYNPDAPPVRYPDPHVIVIDPRFAKYKLGTTHIQGIA